LIIALAFSAVYSPPSHILGDTCEVLVGIPSAFFPEDPIYRVRSYVPYSPSDPCPDSFGGCRHTSAQPPFFLVPVFSPLGFLSLIDLPHPLPAHLGRCTLSLRLLAQLSFPFFLPSPFLITLTCPDHFAVSSSNPIRSQSARKVIPSAHCTAPSPRSTSPHPHSFPITRLLGSPCYDTPATDSNALVSFSLLLIFNSLRCSFLPWGPTIILSV